ncbi:heavy-metal-associated domain-containing protein [Polluticoccus soli]|uniref:heavy-metal-associated domain-containing protein n=1 Tax=Polluticoccus soli TaxID=3034150 RepID=UPI0023E204E8|nr:cation transporter [Flavipsychrobacter sp. JY13-12]
MKRLIVFLSIITSSIFVFAQETAKDVVTEKYKVEGNCKMCKKRIENAAFIKGVKRAEWDKESHELTVTYKPSKTNAEAILGSVAKVGYSSEKAEADKAAYNNLPACCQYKDHVCND